MDTNPDPRRDSHVVAWLCWLVWLGIGLTLWHLYGWVAATLYALGALLVMAVVLAGYGLTPTGHRAHLWAQITDDTPAPRDPDRT